MEEDLSLVSTDNLTAELVRRFDDCIFAGRKHQGEDMPYLIYRRQEGDILGCIGMAMSIATHLANEHEDLGSVTDSEEPGEDEDGDGFDSNGAEH